jgi:hypothetical protein
MFQRLRDVLIIPAALAVIVGGPVMLAAIFVH